MPGTVSHELHDNCIALFKALKARDPDLTARATARGVVIAYNSPEYELMRDLEALDVVASAFATGRAPSLSALRRVETILARELAA